MASRKFLLSKINGLVEKGYQVVVGVSSPRPIDLVNPSGIKLIFLPRWDMSIIYRGFHLVFHLLLFLLNEKKPFQKLSYLFGRSKNKPWQQRMNFVLKSLLLITVNPNIVLFEWNSSAIEDQYLLPLWKSKNVVSCRGSQINVRPYLSGNSDYVVGLKNSLLNATAIHCVSDAIKKQVIQLGAVEEKIHVIRPAVNPDSFFPKALSKIEGSPLNLISVSNLSWVKGLEYSLQAIKKMVEQGVDLRYKIIGDGEDYQRLLYTIHDLGLVNHVKLDGKLSQDLVVEALQKSDVFILSSLSEGISNALLEAMSCGLPVVTTDCGGMTEAVSDGVEGFVVPIRDPAAMSDKLLKLARDQDLRQRMGRAGRERVLAEFNSQSQIEDFVKLFESVRMNETN